MFTGIVATTGNLKSRVAYGDDLRLRFEAPSSLMQDCKAGDSISVSGVCLTMLEPDSAGFSADLSVETLAKTSLGECNSGDSVNLELALRAADRLGGHLVSGHVDGLAVLVSRATDARSERFGFTAAHNLTRFIAEKGSVCLDGVSLTVNDVEGDHFSICVIPHTLDVTTLGNLLPGQKVNLECDLIVRYLDRLMHHDRHNADSTLDTRGARKNKHET